MQERLQKHIRLLTERYPALAECSGDITAAYDIFESCYSSGGKLLVAGNGGSAADSEHIVGELMKGFKLPRIPDPGFRAALAEVDKEMGAELGEKLQGALPTIALDGHYALTTAYMNDVDPLLCFAQQVFGYGSPDDVLLAISTSGRSRNVLYAAVTAKARGMKVVALTGADPGRLSELADVTVRVPQKETYMAQELHLPVYHCWCLMLEDRFFGTD